MFFAIWKKKKNSSIESADQRVEILKKFAGYYFQENVKSCEISGKCSTFLKSCHFCHKPLSLDKEVFMYMGEMGFCSVNCRNRQMYLEEMKKIEITTKRILTSFRQRRGEGGGRCETGNRGVAAPPIFVSE